MTPAERDELNAQVAELLGWHYGIEGDWSHPDAKYPQLTTPDYLGDARLWAPILERIGKLWWVPFWRGNYWELRHLPPVSLIDLEKPIANEAVPFIHAERRSGLLLPEAVLRLFVALKGEV